VTQPDAIRDLLQSVATARLSPEAALEKLQQLNGAPPKKPDPFTESQGYESVGSFAKIDHQRTERTGFPEGAKTKLPSKSPKLCALWLLTLRTIPLSWPPESMRQKARPF
jgi:NCAIR mutase (PurE)-related protein